MFELRVPYPSKEEEAAIVEATTGDVAATVSVVLTAEGVLALQHLVRRIPVSQALVQAAVALVRMTRPAGAGGAGVGGGGICWGGGAGAAAGGGVGGEGRAG